MALPLLDFRTKLPIETLAVIKGHATAFGKDEAELVREILNDWAKRMSHAARLTDEHLRVAGVGGHGRE